ncbi:MAG TPA: hypothetical protein PKM73_06000 [Verrucomicrobiota bacterium]|nr:hypothetical protein [Verrucomicrobiota bacterium]
MAIESSRYADFGRNLKDFLHAFAEARQRSDPLEPMLAPAPPRLAGLFPEGAICDAFLAATADYLARRNRIPTPDWALSTSIALDQPWFSPDLPSVRAMLLRDSPSAFKDKNLFVLDSILDVA